MTGTQVHVKTLKQWKSVLKVWFKQGYSWYSNDQKYHKKYFDNGERDLLLDKDNDILFPTPGKRESISYVEFMAQQKEDSKMATYYVTREQLKLIEELKHDFYPAYELLNTGSKYRTITSGLDTDGEKALLRYIGGNETIEFTVKEQLYRLWLIDDAGDKLFFWIDDGRPDWVGAEDDAFTAPLEEIKKWQTPAWEIEEVN